MLQLAAAQLVAPCCCSPRVLPFSSPFSCPQVLSSSCCSLCSSPARAVHPREGCIHSDLIENELFALISFVLGATLAAAAGRTQPLLLPSPWRPVLPVLLPRASGDALPLLLE